MGNQEVRGDQTVYGTANFAQDVNVGGNVNVAGTVTAQDIMLPNGSLNSRLGTMDKRIDKVGAGAAALAGLQYDGKPGQKFHMAAGFGNYGGQTAGAIGAKYFFNENVSANVATTVGSGENMVSGGISLAFGKVNPAKSKTLDAMVARIEALEKQNQALTNAMLRMSALQGTPVNFPDVPRGHWANKSVNGMKGSNMMEGYPDGTFKGDNNMSRYEYAQAQYNMKKQENRAVQNTLRQQAPELLSGQRFDGGVKSKAVQQYEKEMRNAVKEKSGKKNKKDDIPKLIAVR